MGVTFYVENKGGASGNLGTQMVAEAAPDGCTLLVNGTVIATFLDSYTTLRYDPFKDLTPVGGLGITPTIILAAPSIPATDLKSLMALIEEPAERPELRQSRLWLPAASGDRRNRAAQRRQIRHHPLQGRRSGPDRSVVGARRFRRLLGGTTKAFVQEGKLKALAVLQDKRSVLLPDVPTAKEQGFPGLLGGVHFLLFAPAKTPKDIVAKISAALHKVVSEPDLQEHFLKAGLEATPMTPEEATAAMLEIRKAYQPIIKKLNIKLN